MKTEPDVYSIDDLARDGRGTWEGVRNYQARNFLRAMRMDDLALFYHSNAKPPGVVGVMRIVRTAYPDETQFDPQSPYADPKSPRDAPRWDRVDVAFEEKLRSPVSLDALKSHAELGDMLVVQRGQRLSVQPVVRAHYEFVLKLGR
jgi:predicted RNA-binding protein with PUA-like domain